MSEIVKTFENFDFHIMKEGDTIWWWGKEVAELWVTLDQIKQ